LISFQAVFATDRQNEKIEDFLLDYTPEALDKIYDLTYGLKGVVVFQMQDYPQVYHLQ